MQMKRKRSIKMNILKCIYFTIVDCFLISPSLTCNENNNSLPNDPFLSVWLKKESVVWK